ncbi:hypothetical protein LSCM1_04507 [Leishmania martiniquensis]|uniref:Uncharacterized protein n=1 Tax=Leishmania martiniquensis TaxID=1580590 RepID=A0A836KIA9_9TRYP|nr:hypothetical protein LSCM1_04507 [Leishmania martiniquensis]
MSRHSALLRHGAIMGFSAVMLLLLASAARGQSASSVDIPRCEEDGFTYTATLDTTSVGLITHRGAHFCTTEGAASIVVVQDPSPPHAVVPLGLWSYLVSVNGPTPATFTLNAMCGDTVACQLTVTYAVPQTVVSSSSSTLSESSLPSPSYPPCSHASKERTYAVGVASTDCFPIDIEDAGCSYSVSITTEPSVGTVRLNTSGLCYTYAVPSTAMVGQHTSLGYTVQCNGVTVCVDMIAVVLGPSPTPVPPEKLPWCSHNKHVNIYRVGEVYVGQFLLDVRDTMCSYTTTIEDPSVGTAVVSEPSDPMGYVYSTSIDTTPQDTSIPYLVACNGVSICRGSILIHLTRDAAACPNSIVGYALTPGELVQGTLESGAMCRTGAAPLASLLSAVPGLSLSANGSFVFKAPSTEEDVVVTVLMKCDGEVLCQTKLVLIVATETVAPSTTSTAAPTPTCPVSYKYEVETGQSISGTLVPITSSSCNITTYLLLNSSSDTGRHFQVNLLGNFFYVAPTSELVEYAFVDVYCAREFVCRTQVVFVVYAALTTPPPTRAPLPPCANVYYYETPPHTVLKATLNNMTGQDPCLHGRYFTLGASPLEGHFDLTLNGDFMFSSAGLEGQYFFTFTMHCLGEPYCAGTAYLLVSSQGTLTPTSTLSPIEPGEDANITNRQITCRGTCNANAWKTYPDAKMWDVTPGTGYGRKDGLPADGVAVTWCNNSLVLLVYSLIGNLGVRFPTFELITPTKQSYMEPADFVGRVASSSPGFEMSCLANQGRAGVGEDVWRWTSLSLDSGNGSVGDLYNSGQSWYHKFGGKHLRCDTFTNPCAYAPLLTPANDTNSSLGRWTVDVNDCDVTWTGVFPYKMMNKMLRYDGSPVWKFVGHLQLQGTLYSEAVQASSWLEPGQFDTDYGTHDILINLNQFVAVTKTRVPESLFSVDAELFTYVDTETQDRAFGLNMLVYPFVDSYMTTSYASDRHVKGFKWVSQEWVSPSIEQCPTCTGSKMKCVAPLEGAEISYTGPHFPEGDCADGKGRVRLFKGPATLPGDCTDSKMHLFNRPGFSPTRDCKTAYQNMTLRGIVPGSSGLNETLSRSFNYEGTVQLALLMDDHSYQRLTLRLFLYVSRLTKDAQHLEGGLSTCRSGSYWPVLDPLGWSLPSKPFPLSVAAATPLCIDDLSSSYGPSDWALFTVNMPGVKPSDVTVRSVYVVHNSSRIYLVYKDPITGTVAIPGSEAEGEWWQWRYPFFAFRDLATDVGSGKITYSTQMETSAAAADVVYAFIFIPGSLGVDADIEVVVEASIHSSEAAASTTEFRRVLHIDPLLTQLSRQGPPPADSSSKQRRDKTDLYAIGATTGVAVALVVTAIFFILADNRRPLPKWVPRGKLVKETVLSVLPAGLRGKKKPKCVVHKDMYDAMGSGRY